MEELKVQKNDGTIEDFDKEKLVKSIVAAGVPINQAQGLAGQVESWASGASTEGVIASAEIRTKVIELLGAANASAVEAYQNFKKPSA
ncbi:hypothetical protein HY045_00180 [Candidatus Woesebacteria bacterium]|nr:hypothetical protein [Candidatus Woesebacteria bacterium]